jgi:hypothetical protein
MGTRARSGLIKAGTAVAVVAALAVAGFFGIRSLWNSATTPFTYDHCTVGSYDVDTGQAAVASTMVAVVTSRKLPERAAVLVLAAALQESKLRNIPAGQGDRDSVGVLQQRPSQGWGTATQLSDVRFATGAFLDALTKHADWQTTTLAHAIQQVQISADEQAYARHADEAQVLADVLRGRVPAGITCTFGTPTVVAPVATVARQVAADLPVNAPSTTELTVRVPGAGWQTVAWFVANADRLGIEQVGYDGKRWTRADGWQPGGADPTAVTATMYAR